MKKSDLFDFPIEAISEAPENGLLYDGFNPHDADDAKLIDSIREDGVLTPLRVTRDGILIDGHRRLNAARYAGLISVPAFSDPRAYAELAEQDRLRMLAAPNHQREKSRSERLREAMIEIDPDESYRMVKQHRAEHQRVKVESNITMGATKKRARITTRQFLDAAVAAINSQREYWPITVRRCHYLLLNDPPLRHDKKPESTYTNNQKSYRALSNLLVRARLDGVVPFEAIEDPTRTVQPWNGHRGPESFIHRCCDNLLQGYYRDLMQGQAHHVEIMVEKNGLSKIVERVASSYTIPYTVGVGYSSLPPRYDAAKRFRASGKRKLILLILSDFDPDGEQIAKSFSRSLRDDFGIDDVYPVKVMLTPEDIQKHNLPSAGEAKRGSSNYASFVEQYGTAVTELDAAPVELIQRKLREAIESVIDVDTFNEQNELERGDSQFIAARRRVMLDAIGGMA